MIIPHPLYLAPTSGSIFTLGSSLFLDIFTVFSGCYIGFLLLTYTVEIQGHAANS